MMSDDIFMICGHLDTVGNLIPEKVVGLAGQRGCSQRGQQLGNTEDG